MVSEHTYCFTVHASLFFRRLQRAQVRITSIGCGQNISSTSEGQTLKQIFG